MQTSDIIMMCGNLLGSVFDLMARSNDKAICDHVDKMLGDEDDAD